MEDHGGLTEISLFTGYGGFSLGLRLAGIQIRTVLYCEIEPYCQAIIQQRIKDGFFDDAPIWPDVRTLDGRLFAGKVGIITAGFPCQPHSLAGKRRGGADERNLWPETLRLIREVEPRYALLENVPGILANGYAGAVVGELSEIGYDCIWNCVPAAAVGAPHLRWRWWCLAYASGNKHAEYNLKYETMGRIQQPGSNGESGDVADYDPAGLPELCWFAANAQTPRRRKPDTDNWWPVEPDVGRVADGIAHRVDRLKALGNGIVPAVVRKFLVQ
ncbi:MAG: DNA cytosine methyltransferase [Candidatus Binatia bacterium]